MKDTSLTGYKLKFIVIYLPEKQDWAFGVQGIF